MAMKSHYTKRQYQHGGTLIILFLILVLAGLTALFSVLDGRDVKIERGKKTMAALSEAKIALIGRSVADANRPGSLPCPDSDGDGNADSFVGNLCPSNIGRFPWRTLGTDQLVDGAGELLWYALSQNYRDNSSAEPINGTIPGSLTLDGIGDQLAIIIAPGLALAGQETRPGDNIADYLEGENVDGDNDYNKLISLVQNDFLVSVTRAELMATVSQRILREIKGDATQGLQRYFNNQDKYPYADGDNDGKADAGNLVGTPSYQSGSNSLFFNSDTKDMLRDNGWFPLLNYSVSAAQDSVILSINGKTLTVSP